MIVILGVQFSAYAIPMQGERSSNSSRTPENIYIPILMHWWLDFPFLDFDSAGLNNMERLSDACIPGF